MEQLSLVLNFEKKWNQITSAPYHPATNGLAERAVQTLKNATQKISQQDSYSTIGLHHTGLTPAEMLMGRIRTHLDQIKPDVAA